MYRQGFSLVELSIVLVILGLLTGGILTGQNLIRAAELRSVTTEFQKYQTAIMTFRDRYFHLPGDMSNATDFWSAATCPTAAGTGTATCNGDGDGLVEDAAALSQFGERYTFWQHLANAGLIEGTYTGIAGSNSINDHDIGINSPSGKISNSGWAVKHYGTPVASDTFLFEGDYGNTLYTGAASTSDAPNRGLFTPEEAWNVDKKLDDGLPGLGNVRVFETDDTNSAAGQYCHTGSESASAQASTVTYQLDNTNRNCTILFPNAF